MIVATIGGNIFALLKLAAARRELQSLHRLELALHFGGTLTDIYGLAHCNERGRARADAGRADNGDNLRRRDVNRAAIWPDERNEKDEDR